VTPAPAPEFIGNLHSDSRLHSTKLKSGVYFAAWDKSTAGAILSLPSMNKLCHDFSAGKQLVAPCLSCMRSGLNSYTNLLSLFVLYYHVTISTNQVQLQANSPHTTFGSWSRQNRHYQTLNQEIESYVEQKINHNFLIGNRFHVTVRIISPYICKQC